MAEEESTSVGREVEKARGEGREEEEDMADDVRWIADEDAAERSIFDDEGMAVEGEVRAERLRFNEDFTRSTGGALTARPMRAPAASYTIPPWKALEGAATDDGAVATRVDGVEGGGFEVEGRTTMVPEPPEVSEEIERTPPTHGLRSISQLWHFAWVDNFPDDR